MNTKGNQRSLQTEQKIKSVFLALLKEKDLAHISVSEICSRAQIHRTTFYVHYLDVADLTRKMIQEMYRTIIDLFIVENEGVRMDGFVRLFELVKEHSEFFEMFLKAGGEFSFLHGLLPVELEERLDELVETLGYESRNEMYYHQAFFTAGLSEVMRRWIRGGFQESPEQMGEILTREYNPKTNLFQQEKDTVLFKIR